MTSKATLNVPYCSCSLDDYIITLLSTYRVANGPVQALRCPYIKQEFIIKTASELDLSRLNALVILLVELDIGTVLQPIQHIRRR